MSGIFRVIGESSKERYIALTKKQLLHDTKNHYATYLLIKLDNEKSYG